MNKKILGIILTLIGIFIVLWVILSGIIGSTFLLIVGLGIAVIGISFFLELKKKKKYYWIISILFIILAIWLLLVLLIPFKK
jgi:heme/copper-type cytochrome/quinol oxidase subunit 4